MSVYFSMYLVSGLPRIISVKTPEPHAVEGPYTYTSGWVSERLRLSNP